MCVCVCFVLIEINDNSRISSIRILFLSFEDRSVYLLCSLSDDPAFSARKNRLSCLFMIELPSLQQIAQVLFVLSGVLNVYSVSPFESS